MPPKRQKIVQTAEKLVARGRLQAAIDQYRKVLEQEPNDSSTLNRVGDLYVRLNRVPRATELFRQTAENFARQGFFVKAIAIYKKIIRLDPSQIQAYEALADLYFKEGLGNDARAQYQVVADYYLKHEELDSAIDIHKRMIEIEPGDPSARLKLADVLEKNGRTAESLQQYLEIGNLMISHGKVEEAERVFEGGLDIDSADMDYLGGALGALREAGDLEAAQRLLDKATAVHEPAASFQEMLDQAAEERDLEGVKLPEAVVEEEVPEVVEEIEAAAESEPAVEGAETLAVEESESELVLDLDDPAMAGVDLAGGEAEAESIDLEAVAEAADSAEELEFKLDVEEDDAEPPPAVLETEAALEAVVAEVEQTVEPAEGGVELVVDLDEEAAAPEVAEELAVEEVEAPEAVESEETEEEEVFELEIDLDGDDFETAVAEAEDGTAPEAAAADVEPEEVETAEEESVAEAAPVVPTGPPTAADKVTELIGEAEVLTRYGMDELAAACFDRALEIAPDHPECLTKAARANLRAGRRGPAVELANRLVGLVESPEELADWNDLRADFGELEIDFADGQFVDSGPPAVEVGAAGSEEPGLGDLAAEVETELAAAEEASTGEDETDVVEITLKTPAGYPGAEPPAVEEPTTEVEDDFFDLAHELEAELFGDADVGEELLPPVQEQSVEEIVEGFRKGMEESLSAEDYDTHYNLGIAYREMGLTDEAIGEFQLAAKDPRYLIDCCSLLAGCFLEKGFSELAVQWYEKGLAAPTLGEDDRLGLLYELGNLELALGEKEAARQRFIELYGLNSNYRDVVAKLEELGSSAT